MSISSIKQRLESIDYDWRKPQTYLVFVPGLSLVIQKVQMARALPLPEFDLSSPGIKEDAEKSRRFANICKWHLRGSLLQCAALTIAVKTFATPLFLVLGVLAMYELADTFIKSLRNKIALIEFHPNGNPKNLDFGTACNIF